ncbi:class-III pyridoxal-phosphate-dependent aminotransferase [Nocardioides dilutus]
MDDRTRPTRQEVLQLAEKYVCPDRVRMLTGLHADLVIGKREGYRIWDLDGRELLDLHLNGGTFNLGHRHPALVEELRAALDRLDIGNHHFPSVERSLLAEQLVALTPGMRYAVFGSGGGEAVDLALKSARRATGRTRVVSATGGYHGHTGLALAAGDERAAAAFGSTGAPGEFVHVPFNDAAAVEAACAAGDVAALILETVPATVGFVAPTPDYLNHVEAICRRHGTALVLDEVQTGLGRTGPLWAFERYQVQPNAVVTAKGLSGGLFPISATLLDEWLGGWLEEDGWGHVSTFGGAELGCPVARRVLDITTDPATTGHVESLISTFSAGLGELRGRHPEWLLEVRQTGLVIGLQFAHPQGGMLMTGALMSAGVWAIYAGFDPSCLQFKPGLLLSDDDARTALAALDTACAQLAGAVADG